MIQTWSTESSQSAVKDQAMAWIVRLAAGAATTEDAEALHRWRNESPGHRQAFAEAKLLWEVLGAAAEEVAPRLQARGSVIHPAGPARPIGSRALIGGALAVSGGGVGYAGARPPFRLWPSIGELRADYRTVTGEQRQLALS